MTENRYDEEKIGSAVRDFLAAEVDTAEIEREKRQLISRYFGERPTLVFRPRMFVPVLGIAAIFVIFSYFWVLPKKGVELKQSEVAQLHLPVPMAAPELAVSGAPAPAPVPGAVLAPVVKRLSSDVGPTLVYQKTFQKAPITIVWVFAGGP